MDWILELLPIRNGKLKKNIATPQGRKVANLLEQRIV